MGEGRRGKTAAGKRHAAWCMFGAGRTAGHPESSFSSTPPRRSPGPQIAPAPRWPTHHGSYGLEGEGGRSRRRSGYRSRQLRVEVSNAMRRRQRRRSLLSSRRGGAGTACGQGPPPAAAATARPARRPQGRALPGAPPPPGPAGAGPPGRALQQTAAPCGAGADVGSGRLAQRGRTPRLGEDRRSKG